MAVTQEFREGWLEMQEEYGRKIDVGSIQVMDVGEIDATVSLPGGCPKIFLTESNFVATKRKSPARQIHVRILQDPRAVLVKSACGSEKGAPTRQHSINI